MKFNTNPEFETKVEQMCNIVTKIDNDYLQAWADAGAYVMAMGGGWWIMLNDGQLWFKIHEDKMHLECIAVRDDDRKQGRGSRMMGYVTQFADETNTQVSLEVSMVTSGNYMGMHHPVVVMGQPKKNKIPVRSLPKWYQKFGFQKTEKYTEKKRSMIYTPKKK